MLRTKKLVLGLIGMSVLGVGLLWIGAPTQAQSVSAVAIEEAAELELLQAEAFETTGYNCPPNQCVTGVDCVRVGQRCNESQGCRCRLCETQWQCTY